MTAILQRDDSVPPSECYGYTASGKLVVHVLLGPPVEYVVGGIDVEDRVQTWRVHSDYIRRVAILHWAQLGCPTRGEC